MTILDVITLAFGLLGLAIIVSTGALAFGLHPTARFLRPLERRRERRRKKKLDPIAEMVEWKANRRKEEIAQWFEGYRRLSPQPDRYDHEGQRVERELFSGNPARARRALAPPEKVVARTAAPRQSVHPLVKNGDGEVILGWDGRHLTTCPYECDCPQEYRREP